MCSVTFISLIYLFPNFLSKHVALLVPNGGDAEAYFLIGRDAGGYLIIGRDAGGYFLIGRGAGGYFLICRGAGGYFLILVKQKSFLESK